MTTGEKVLIGSIPVVILGLLAMYMRLAMPEGWNTTVNRDFEEPAAAKVEKELPPPPTNTTPVAPTAEVQVMTIVAQTSTWNTAYCSGGAVTNWINSTTGRWNR